MTRRPANRLDAQDVVASFDSATVLHAALSAALRGEPFPHLGNGPLAGAAIRAAGRLPWPLLRRLYTRIGASEGVDPGRLGDVDMNAVAGWLADGYPQRCYPAALVGSSNGALAHLAAAMQVPWLPGTVLVPVARTGDPQRPVDALHFGERAAPALLDRNPDVVLHHMHDQVQDELMVARMTYFRIKWQTLPEPYARFLTGSLAPGAPVVLVEDRSRWPVVRVGDRHVFQTGAQGGLEPQAYLDRPHTPRPDGEEPEAEWGADPQFGTSLAGWCVAHGHPLLRIAYSGPQAPAHAVASVVRDWYTRRGEPADRLVVPSFVLGDPWRTLNAAAVPFWTFFSVQPALRALEDHLLASAPYRNVDILLFQHGVHSAGIARPEEWVRVARGNGATARLMAVSPRRFPHDIASLGRYGRMLAELPGAHLTWSPLEAARAVRELNARLDDPGPTHGQLA
ncbi:hypothetical protein [Pseudonocardia sp.]|jgi:hypothetical protein|uniref:hypothetical protein n=1 Tax=Pseudonocardia sp. TaxID=60912 RepID=UPI0031FBE691